MSTWGTPTALISIERSRLPLTASAVTTRVVDQPGCEGRDSGDRDRAAEPEQPAATHTTSSRRAARRAPGRQEVSAIYLPGRLRAPACVVSRLLRRLGLRVEPARRMLAKTPIVEKQRGTSLAARGRSLRLRAEPRLTRLAEGRRRSGSPRHNPVRAYPKRNVAVRRWRPPPSRKNTAGHASRCRRRHVGLFLPRIL